jgi:hypothetical protein
MESLSKMQNMELEDWFTLTKANTMDNGRRERNKVRVCLYTSIKIFTPESGSMERNMAKVPMSSMLPR